jgi:hypothetical protein
MVVKPLSFIARGKKGLLQPAIKCRGREYLRPICGPDYDLERLKKPGWARSEQWPFANLRSAWRRCDVSSSMRH